MLEYRLRGQSTLVFLKREHLLRLHTERKRDFIGRVLVDRSTFDGCIHSAEWHAAFLCQRGARERMLFQFCCKVDFGHGTDTAFSGTGLGELKIKTV